MAHNKFLGHSQWSESRVVTKISRCWVNTTSRQGIKQLRVSFGSMFLLLSFKVARGLVLLSFKVARGLVHSSQEGGKPQPPVHHACLYISLLHDYGLKMPHFKFYRGSAQVTMKFPLSSF